MIRTRTPSALRWGSFGLAAVFILGGCAGSRGGTDAQADQIGSSSTSPTANSSPTESATASATPSPTAAYKPATPEGPAENVPLPVMPDIAKEASKEGLEAFATHWFDLVNYGYETGDAGP